MFSAIVGMLKAFLFLFPFILDIFFGKSPNPYSRNPKEWESGKPAKPWIRKTAVVVAICAMAIIPYGFKRIYSLNSEIVELKQELKNTKDILDLQRAATNTAEGSGLTAPSKVVISAAKTNSVNSSTPDAFSENKPNMTTRASFENKKKIGHREAKPTPKAPPKKYRKEVLTPQPPPNNKETTESEHLLLLEELRKLNSLE